MYNFTTSNNKTMTILNLNSKKVSKKTATEIQHFIYENKATLSNDMKIFYSDVVSFINKQLRKKASCRMTMPEILERCYNIEKYVLNAGALSYESEYLTIN